MKALRLWLALACVLGAPGCSEQRLLGRACTAGDCARDASALPAPAGCGVQLRTGTVVVRSGMELEYCELFTLDALPQTGDQGQVYLTRAEIMRTPFTQHLDVRLAPQLEDFDDGPVECSELWSRAVAWIPLMTTQDGGEAWDLSAAPLVAAASHRLLINQHMLNLAPHAVEVAATLNVECADVRPATVSQAFEFTDRTPRSVRPGERQIVPGNCVFNKDVLVSRLYRRTHLITTFTVHALHGSRDGELLWPSGPDWTLDLEPPLRVAAGEGFHWQCTYDNTAHLAFQVGGDSPDACALLGLYRLPDGGEDASPERCTR